MAIKISQNISQLAPSMTLALTAKAKAMKAEGIDIVSFGAGEPDFDTPDFVKNVAIEDLQNGVTKYTPVKGTPDLLKAIAEILEKDYGQKYDPATEIIVSTGGKHSLYNLFACMIDPGDEVIVPAPFWLSYPEQIRAFAGKPVIVDCPIEDGFKLTPAKLRAAISDRTIAVVLNSPSNPTGAVYTKEELQALGEVLKEYPNITIVSDDLYMKLVYAPATFVSLLSLFPEFRDRFVIINGLSKAYSMTGWRLGWMAAPAGITKSCAILQGQSTSNPTSFTQRAAAVALRSDHSFLTEWVKAFDGRRQLIVDLLNDIPGIKINPAPQGAFYAFPDVSGTYGKTYNGHTITDSMSFANILLEQTNVSVVPGVAFGADNCVRLSYATSEANIRKGLERMKAFLTA